MSRSLNLSLTDELRSYIDSRCGDGTTFATPSEFVRAVLREKKDREESAAVRSGVLAGYRDVLDGRVVEYQGGLDRLLAGSSASGESK